MQRFRSLIIVLLVVGPSFGQDEAPTDIDFARLGHPSVAEQLSLSDQQRAEVSRLLTARATALATADAAARDDIVANINRELAALLSDGQRQQLQELTQAVKMQFNFDGQKWSDVLQWLSEQADMTLVFDRLPEQKFSYRDNRSYTVGEAIDLLNGVLISKGFTLIRRGKLLIVADISQQLPADLLPQIQLEDLPDYGQFEFVKILFPLGGRPADTVEKEVQAVIGPFGNIAALPQTGQLLVTETAGKMRAISALIASIPVPEKPAPPQPPKAAPKPTLVVHAVRDVDPDAALETLRQLVPEAKLTVDRTASTINAFAVPAEQEAIKGILQQLMAGSTPELRPRLESYALPASAPAELVAQLGHIAPRCQITIDEPNQRLLVFGSPAEQAVIARTLAALDSEAAPDRKKHVAVYKLKHAQAATTAESLQTLAPDAVVAAIPNANTIIVRGSLSDQTSISALIEKIDVEPDGQMTTTLKLYPLQTQQQAAIVTVLSQVVPEANVSWDDQNRRLVVIATTEQQEQAGRIISQLATATSAPDKQTLHVYTFAPHLQPRVSALISNMSPAIPALKVIDDTQEGELAVLANANQHAQLSELVAQLKQAEQQRERLVLQAYPILNATPDSLSALMGELFPQTKIVVDSDARRLLVWAAEETHTNIRQAIQQLDVETTAKNLEKLITYDAPGLELTNVLTLLNPQYPDMVLNVDSENSKILAWGSVRDHQRLAIALAELREANPPRETSIQVYPTTPRAPDQVIPLISGSVPGATLTADGETGTIIARATDEEHRLLKAALDQLPAPDSGPSQRTLVAYPIEEPADIANAVSVLANIAPQASVSTASDNRQLFVWATASEHDRVRETLKTLSLDSRTNTSRDFKIYKVSPGTADTVATILADVAPEARMTSQTANQITIWAHPEDHQQIAAVLEQFTAANKNTDWSRQFKAYQLDPRISDTVSTMLVEVAPDARITSQTASQIIVWALPEDHQQIASLLEQLVAEVKTEKTGVRAYWLHSASGSDLIELLDGELSAGAETAVSNDGARLIVRATSAEHERLAQLIPDLIGQLGKLTRPGTLRVYPLHDVSGSDLIELLSGELSPEVETALSSDGARLIIRATSAEHEKLAQTIPNLIRQLGQEEKPVNRIYRPQVVDPDTLVDVFDDLYPGLQTSADDDGRLVAVTALPSVHENLQRMFEQLEQGEADRPTPKTYRLTKADANAVYDALRFLLRRNSRTAISVESETNSILVVAPSREQQLIAKIIEEFNVDPSADEGPKTTEVYALSEVSPRTIAEILESQLSKDAVIASDRSSTMVIVRASAADHAQARETLDRLAAQLPAADTRTSQVYRVETADPDVVEAIFEDLAPRARIAVDRGSRTVAVTGSAAEHERLAEVLAQLEAGTSQLPIPKTYNVKESDPAIVYRSLLELYDDVPDVSVTWQPGSNAILAMASPRNHETIRTVIQEFDKPGGISRNETLEVFALQDINGNSAQAAIASLLSGENPAPRVELDAANNQLLAIGTQQQHETIRGALERMKRERRDIEFFQLQANDAFTLKLAIDELFKDLPESAGPTVESNIETQQLIVRATGEQLQRIRELLAKMGEDVVDPTEGDQRRLRVIPFYGNVRDTMGRLREVWPQLHTNELRVIYPADFDQGTLLKTLPSHERLDGDINPPPATNSQPDGRPLPTQTPVPQIMPQTAAPSDTPQVTPDTPQATPPPAPKAPAPDPTTPPPKSGPDAPPPIVVIPGEGKLTITSEDSAALNEFEALLRVFSSPDRTPANDVAIFGLRNASAAETSQLLKEFFKELPTWGRMGQVVVVPDARLNALVVHGSRAGRQVVREILTVLDSGESAAQAAWNTPRIIPVRIASATRILKVLQTVYATQLSSGGGRRQQINIPEGVDKDVAEVLEQINAAASGPLLTLEVDEETNSIIVLGPPQLADEVTALIGQLDAGAADAAARGIRVISLQNIRSELLEEVLEGFRANQ